MFFAWDVGNYTRFGRLLARSQSGSGWRAICCLQVILEMAFCVFSKNICVAIWCVARDLDCLALVGESWEAIEGPEQSRVSRLWQADANESIQNTYNIYVAFDIDFLRFPWTCCRFTTALQSPRGVFCWWAVWTSSNRSPPQKMTYVIDQQSDLTFGRHLM